MSVLPIDIASLMDGVIDLKKRVGLAAHRSVTEKTSDDELVLHSRQTSHGIAHRTHEVRQLGVHRYKPMLERHFCRHTPIVEVPNQAVDVDSWA